MMKYDELIKDLRICASTFTEPCEECSHTETGDCYNKLKRNAADAIEELQKQLREEHAKNLWIPVSERLPGTGEVVLVCGKRGGIYTAEHNRNGRWPGSFWKLNSKSHHCEPTHWMPLPSTEGLKND